MKYAKIRKSVLQRSNDNGLTWENVSGTSEEVMVCTFNSDNGCETTTTIGVITQTPSGKNASLSLGDGTIIYQDCLEDNNYYGFNYNSNVNTPTILTANVGGECVNTVYGTCFTVQSKGVGFENAVSLRRVRFSDSVKEIRSGLSGLHNHRYNYNLVDIQFSKGLETLAFELRDTKLVEVTIPETMEKTFTWSMCSTLRNIVLKNKPRELDADFASGTRIESFEIPNSVEKIGDRAFMNCTSLTSVTIPSSVTYIGDSAFSGCTSLSSVTIPSSVTYIGAAAFAECPITNVIIPSSITELKEYSFYGCPITSITMPSVTIVGDNFLGNNKAVSSFTFSDSITTMGEIFSPRENISYEESYNLEWLEFGSGLTAITTDTLLREIPYIRAVRFKGQYPPENFNINGGASNMPIYVIDEYVNQWKTSLPSYANRIKPLSSFV